MVHYPCVIDGHGGHAGHGALMNMVVMVVHGAWKYGESAGAVVILPLGFLTMVPMMIAVCCALFVPSVAELACNMRITCAHGLDADYM